MIILFSFLSCIFDNTVNYYLPFLPRFFYYFRPMLFVSTVLIYMILSSSNKKNLYIVLGSGLMYDLLFGSVYFLYLTIFLILFIFITFIKNHVSSGMFVDFILFVVGLILFIILKFLILKWTNYYNYSSLFLLNQIFTSLILNILYASIIYFILGIKLKKH